MEGGLLELVGIVGKVRSCEEEWLYYLIVFLSVIFLGIGEFILGYGFWVWMGF